MNDSSEQPEADAPSPRWLGSIRWFGAEFLVVVCGVLVALALQAWYEFARDLRLEQIYLQQLSSDLARTAELLSEAISQDSIHLDANLSLVAALYRPEAPSPDSARKWLRLPLGSYSDPRPVMGTVTTLSSTGDIRLIRDPVLRTEIVAYGSSVLSDFEELSRNVDRLIQANDVERQRWEFLGTTSINASSDETEDLRRYIAQWPLLQGDPELRAACQVRLRTYFNRLGYLRRMLASTDTLRGLVQRGISS